jgi:hypothetical protein
MPYEILTNGTSITDILVNVSINEPGLFPMLLLFIYAVVAGAGYVSQIKRTVNSNMLMWMTISGMVTTVIAILLYMVAGLISIETLTLCVVVFVGTAMFYFLKNIFSEE